MADEMQSPKQFGSPQKQDGLGKGNDKQDVDIIGEIRNLSSRLRILEERYTNLKRKDMITEQNMLTNHKTTNSEIKSINSELSEMGRKVDTVSNRIKLMVNELGLFSKKEDVKVLEKYINMWDPLKFVTEDEVIKIVKRLLEERSN